MTVIIVRDVPPKLSGHLGTFMTEVSTGVFVCARLSSRARDRCWAACSSWMAAHGRGSVVMVWRAPAANSGFNVQVLGTPPRDVVDLDGMLLSRRNCP